MRRVLAVVIVIASSVAIGLVAAVSPAAAVVPSGFTDTQVANPPGNPLSSPTGIVPLPGNRGLITEKGGAVRVLQADGTLLDADALTLKVCAGSEMGLLGAAIDPAFIINGYVYLYYTRDAGNCSSATGRFNRVSRFTMVGNTISSTSELVLLDNIAATGGNHDGGDLEIGQDGYLYVSVGDAGSDPRPGGAPAAQDLSLLNGKILRITAAGGIPPDNPLVGAADSAPCATAGIAAPENVRCLEIYSWGLRNPYRFAFDPNTGGTRFFINDVGQNTWEEVDEGLKGADYGWPAREGPCVQGSTTNCPPPPAGVTDPLTSYDRSTGCSFITAAAFVPNGWWPSDYDGSYLFADGGCNKIFRRTAAGVVDYASPFAQVAGTIVDMAFISQGQEPSLFYVTNSSSQLHRIAYDAPPAPSSSTLAYTAQAAYRPYDSRADGALRAGSTRYIDLGINSANVKAAMVNLTMVQPIGQGFLTASQGRTERPSTSNINASDGSFVANASIVPVGPDGHVLIYSSVTTNFVVDVLGVFSDATSGTNGGRYTAITPARLIDTRQPANATNSYTRTQNSAAKTTVNAPLGGKLGVPTSVASVALIVTGVADPVSVAGYITAYPNGTTEPATSNVNVNSDGDVRPNIVFVPLGADGSINLTLFNVAHVVVDVAGYFVNTTGAAGLYHVVAPSRQVDTRTPLGFGPLGIAASGLLDPGGSVPAGARAISQNVTMTQTLGPGFVTAYPSDSTLPLASNGNATGPSQDRASLTITRIGANGQITYFSSGGTNLVVDVTGYFD